MFKKDIKKKEVLIMVNKDINDKVSQVDQVTVEMQKERIMEYECSMQYV